MQADNQYPPQSYDDDEIDLRDLVRTLIKQKKIIVLIALISLVSALTYALLATPVYKARASFLPPTEADVAALNINNATDATDATDATTVYAIFEKNLNSIKIRRDIFNKLELVGHYTESTTDQGNITAAFEKFNEQISVEKPKAKKGEEAIPAIYLSMSGADPELLARVLNELEMISRVVTKQEVITGVTEKINLKKDRLREAIGQLRNTAEKRRNDEITRLLETDKIEQQKLTDRIKALRSSAKIKREDRIQVLTEAAKIAESLGITDKSSLLDSNITSASDKNAFYTEVTTQAQPLYLRGSKALRSEIKELAARTSDDPFIPELRDLQDKLALLQDNPQVNALKNRKNNDPFIESLRDKESELALLEAMSIDPDKVKVALVDQPAFPPTRREKPKRSLIVTLGAVLGVFLGILAAFMVNFWGSLREDESGKV